MLRQALLYRNLALIRQKGSLPTARFSTKALTSIRDKLSQLKSSNNVSSSAYVEILNHKDTIDGQDVQIIEEVINISKKDTNLSSDHRVQLHNLVLKNFLKYDYSLSMIHQREISDLKGQVDPASMAEIIKYNPGRVKSSWEIFEKFAKTLDQDVIKSQELLTAILFKLVYGDASEIEDGYKMNDTTLARSVFIMKNLETVPEDLKTKMLAYALESGSKETIKLIGVDSLNQIQALEANTTDFVELWKAWNPQQLSQAQTGAVLDRIPNLLSRLSYPEAETKESDVSSLSEKINKLNEKYPQLQVKVSIENHASSSEAFETLVQILEDQKLPTNPEMKYTALRLALLKAYGINKLDYKHALYLYHEFISLDKSNVDKIMTTMVAISAYLGVKSKDANQLLIAETMAPQPINIPTLQALILGYSAFDLEKSLEFFNDYIQKVSKECNESGVSQASLLTESLVLAYLSKRDREFAYLIHDGAIMNNVVTSETSKTRFKAIFKKYGEILGEEEKEKIDGLLEEEVLTAISIL